MKVFFRQIKSRGDNFSYIVADNATKEAIIVDPSFNSDTIIRVVRDRDLIVKYVIATHHHRDHVAGNEEIKTSLGAKVVGHKLSLIDKDVTVNDGDSLQMGNIVVRVIHTPGHSPDSICLLIENKILTGDTLFVGECGRTDLPGGDPEDMYHSLFNKLMKLEDTVEVFPGHDYGSTPRSTIGREKKTNYVLKKRTLEEFIEFMKGP